MILDCYKCGKKALVNGLCRDCFLEGKELFEVKEGKVKVCRNCGKFYVGEWRKGDLAFEYLKKNLDVDFEYKKKEEHDYLEIWVKGKGYIGDFYLEEEKSFKLYKKYVLCDKCSKLVSGYYEALVQVRREKGILDEKEVSEILSSLEDYKITKVERRKEGIDIYFFDRREARKQCVKLQKIFGGVIGESFKVTGHDKQKTKDIKRITYVLKLPKYRVGDFVRIEDQGFRVTGNFKVLKLENAIEKKMLSWKKVEILERKNKIKKLRKAKIEKVRVIDVNPTQIEVMFSDYTTKILRKPKGLKLEIGREYKVVVEDVISWM